MNLCPICSQLKDVETSFFKYAAPEYDLPLPAAAARLVILKTLDADDPDKQHVRRCPLCGALYSYRFSYEYLVNGSEDEEELTRLSSSQTEGYYRTQARLLEGLRRQINELESAAGSLGDYLDRGRPSPAEEREAFNDMQGHRQVADQLRMQLDTQVMTLRQTCPEILAAWAAPHMDVCRSFLSSLGQGGADVETARYVA